ncbi:hypothetical protein ACOME3_001067 [Neoechinorhynchus agilis]
MTVATFTPEYFRTQINQLLHDLESSPNIGDGEVARRIVQLTHEIQKGQSNREVRCQFLKLIADTGINRTKEPARLLNFIIKAFEQDDICAFAATKPLFILITQHNLEYKRLFPRFLELLDMPEALCPSQNNQFGFIEVLGSCLSSPLIPRDMIESFTKKFCSMACTGTNYEAILCLDLVAHIMDTHERSVNDLLKCIGSELRLLSRHYQVDVADKANNIANGIVGKNKTRENKYHLKAAKIQKKDLFADTF